MKSILRSAFLFLSASLFWSQIVVAAPIESLGLLKAEELVLGSYHVCALSEQRVHCWGLNHFGQLGTGDFNPTPSLVPSPGWPKTIVAGAGGLKFTCFHDAQAIYCAGELENFKSSTPRKLFESALPIRKLVASHLGMCALFANPVLPPRCFGKTESLLLSSVTFPGEIEELSIGANQLCAISRRDLLCLELGEGGVRWKKMMPLPSGYSWVRLSSGANHSCAIRSSDHNPSELFCWGDNRFFQSGTSEAKTLPPTRISTPRSTSWISVSTGDTHTCASNQDRVMYCFGDNFKSQSSPMSRLEKDRIVREPKPVPYLRSVLSVHARGLTTCALLKKYFSCWGVIGSGIERE